MNKYELLVIFTPTLSEQDWKKETSNFRDFLKKNTKAIFFEDIWGMKPLAYRIKKFDHGHYAIFYFEAEPEQIHEVRTNIKLNTNVIRHLLISLPENFDAKKYEEAIKGGMLEVPEERPVRVRKAPLKKIPYTVPKEPAAPVSEQPPAAEPLLKGQTEEEKLKEVEKTLESILENPDIEIK